MFAAHRGAAGSYRNLSVETSLTDADPHRLIAMLYDGALDSIARARHALKQHDVAARGAAISRSIRIIGEGLKGSLDDRGGELTMNLRSLYEYMEFRLLQANIDAEDSMLEEVGGLLAKLRDAWTQIAPER
jgi:flagellar secretion chaperone FliS